MPGSCCFGDAEQLTITDSAALGRAGLKMCPPQWGGGGVNFFPFRSGDKLAMASYKLLSLQFSDS